VEPARRVLERLDRIEHLRGGGAPPQELLGEVRLLLSESEEWLRSEGNTDNAKEVVDQVKDALRRGERGVLDRKRTLLA
jgi:hypothetical protein